MIFTIEHFQALSPLIITCLTCVVVMLAIAWKRHHTFNTLVCLLGLNLALAATYWAAKVIPNYRHAAVYRRWLCPVLYRPNSGIRPGQRNPN